MFLTATLLVDRKPPRWSLASTSLHRLRATRRATPLRRSRCTSGLAIVIWSLVRSTTIRAVAWIVAFAVPIFVGVSRLYRGMHHLTDVIASVLLGCGVVLFALLTTRAAVASEEHDDDRPSFGARAADRGRVVTSIGVIAHTDKQLGGGLDELRACARATRVRRSAVARGAQEQVRTEEDRGSASTQVSTSCSCGGATAWCSAASTRSARHRSRSRSCPPAPRTSSRRTSGSLATSRRRCGSACMGDVERSTSAP